MFDETETILNKTVVLNATENWDTITVELKTLQNYKQFAERITLKYLKLLYPTTGNNRLNLEIKEIAYGAKDIINNDDALTGIPLYAENNDEIVKIFPNPAKNYVTVKLLSQEINLVELIDNSGKCMKRWVVSEKRDKFNLNIANFRAGIYYLAALAITPDQKKRYCTKFIKVN